MALAPSHQANSFDSLRIAAALMVLFSHAYVLSGRAPDELARHTGLGGFGELSGWGAPGPMCSTDA